MKFVNKFNFNELKNQIVFSESDNFNLNQFCEMKKITKWIYAPVVGTILYFLIFKTFCEVNLIDRKRAYFNKIKFGSLLFYPQLFLILVFVFVLIIVIVLPSLSNVSTLNKIMYILIPLYFILVISPFLSILAKMNLKRILKVDKISENESCIVVYKNAEISNNKNYFESLLKQPNHKINKFFLSDNFENINSDHCLTENYEGTKIQKMENYAQKQNQNINIVWFLMPFAFFIIWVSRYFDYFFFCNILFQKAKQDNKINLSKKSVELFLLTIYLQYFFGSLLFYF